MPVPGLTAMPDLKPAEYNPFLDGTVRNRDVGGQIVPTSTGSGVDLKANTVPQARPTRASTAGRLDNAIKAAKTGTVRENAAALRGWTKEHDRFDTRAFEEAVDNLSPQALEELSDGLSNLGNGRAPMRGALTGRQALKGFVRQGSAALGVLGTVADLAYLGDALLDPSNQPYGEIGDVAGSMAGGALGSALGPVGALGGSILGGMIGSALGNMLEGGPTPDSLVEGEPAFQGGQIPGVKYIFEWSYTSNYGNGGPITSGATGPISLRKEQSTQPSTGRGVDKWSLLSFAGATRTLIQMTGPVDGYPGLTVTISNMRRADGEPDTGGNPRGNPTSTPTKPYYPTRDRTSPNRTRPDIVGPSNPGLDLNPLDLTGPGSPGGGSDPLGDRAPAFDNPPTPDDLPEDKPTSPPGGGPSPNPEPKQCCPTTVGKLDEILALLTQEYAGTVDLTGCDGEQDLHDWYGVGISGAIEAIRAAQFQAQAIHGNTKCGPDPAPLPMLWEVKGSQVGQLAIVWARTEGGSSRWTMHVPHPKEEIDQAYAFNIPDYTKGSLLATLKLKDNSKLIVNGLDKANCNLVIDYFTTNIIEPEFLIDSKLTYTEGAANRATAEVTAKHITAFKGEKGTPPLWARSLSQL